MSPGERGVIGTLHVCAVPIGNLGDASPRLREVLERVDVIACEDTRTTRRLLDLLGIDTHARLLAHHEHNEAAGAAGIAALLRDGAQVALVTDAGSPGVSDPGSLLVAAAHQTGAQVVAVPGPSSVVAALGVAGFPSHGFSFVGFLPRRPSDAAAAIANRPQELVVALDSPHRVAGTVSALAELQASRPIAVCRELTKQYEAVVRGAASDVTRVLADEPVRGEVVVVAAPMQAEAAGGPSAADVELVEVLVAEGVRTKRACSIVANAHGGAARALFEAVLARRDEDV